MLISEHLIINTGENLQLIRYITDLILLDTLHSAGPSEDGKHAKWVAVLQFFHNKRKFPYVVLRDIAGIILGWQKGKVKN